MIEKKLLSLCLKDQTILIKVMQRGIGAELFNTPDTATFFRILMWFYKNYKIAPTYDALIETVNQSTLAQELRETIPVLYIELNNLNAIEPVDFLMDCLIKNYKEHTLRNTLANVVDDLNNKKVEETIEKVRKSLAIFDTLNADESREGDYKHSIDERSKTYDSNKLNPIIGIPYGLPTLDSTTGGQLGGELWIIAGFLKSGKSCLLLNMANYAWKQGKNVVYFSAEVSKKVLERRLDAMNSSLSSTCIKRGSLALEEEVMYKAQLEEMKAQKAMFYIVDTPGITADFISAKLQELKMINKVDLIVVDYIGLLKSNHREESDWKRVGNIALDLRHIARLENIPVLTAHQLNREGGKTGKTNATHLAHSLEVGMHADLVLSIKVRDDDEKLVSPICTIDASVMLSRDSAAASFTIDAIFDKMQMTESLAMH